MGCGQGVRIAIAFIFFWNDSSAFAGNKVLQECLKQLQERSGEGSSACTQQPPPPHTPSREINQIQAKIDPNKVTLTASGFSGGVVWAGSENRVNTEFNKSDAQKVIEARENEKIQTRLYQAFSDRAEASIRAEMARFKKVRDGITDFKKASQGIEHQIRSFNSLCAKLKSDSSANTEVKTALASIALSGMVNSELFRTLIVSPRFQKRISSDLVDLPSAMNRCLNQGKGIRPRTVTSYTGASIYAPSTQVDDATYMSETDLRDIFADAQDNLKKGIADIDENRATIRKLKPLPATATAREWADRVRTLRIMNGDGAQYYPVAMLAVANEVKNDRKYGLRDFGEERVTVEVCQSIKANARSKKDSDDLNALVMGAGLVTLPLAFAVPGAGVALFSLMMGATQAVEGMRQMKIADKVEVRALAGTLSRMLDTTTARNEINEASIRKAMEFAGLIAGAMGAAFDGAQLVAKLRPMKITSVAGEMADGTSDAAKETRVMSEVSDEVGGGRTAAGGSRAEAPGGTELDSPASRPDGKSNLTSFVNTQEKVTLDYGNGASFDVRVIEANQFPADHRFKKLIESLQKKGVKVAVGKPASGNQAEFLWEGLVDRASGGKIKGSSMVIIDPEILLRNEKSALKMIVHELTHWNDLERPGRTMAMSGVLHSPTGNLGLYPTMVFDDEVRTYARQALYSTRGKSEREVQELFKKAEGGSVPFNEVIGEPKHVTYEIEVATEFARVQKENFSSLAKRLEKPPFIFDTFSDYNEGNVAFGTGVAKNTREENLERLGMQQYAEKLTDLKQTYEKRFVEALEKERAGFEREGDLAYFNEERESIEDHVRNEVKKSLYNETPWIKEFERQYKNHVDGIVDLSNKNLADLQNAKKIFEQSQRRGSIAPEEYKNLKTSLDRVVSRTRPDPVDAAAAGARPQDSRQQPKARRR